MIANSLIPGGMDIGTLGRIFASPKEKVYDSCVVDPSMRLDYWRNQVMTGNGLELVCGTPNFIATFIKRDFGLFSLFGVNTSTPHRAVRSESCEDLCFINLQYANDGAYFRGNYEADMSVGSMSVYEATPGYELEFPGNSSSYVLAVPKSYLCREVSGFSRHLEEPIEYDPALIALLSSMCGSILQNHQPFRQSVIDGVGASITNVLLAILNDANGVSESLPTIGQSSMIHRVRTLVRNEISDPCLCPQKIADKAGITVSYLHKVFRAEKTTLMQYVLSERLERCRSDIAKFERSANFSQIAFAWGFNDASHFTRSFRSKFGLSPREYRQKIESREKDFADS